MEIKVTVENSRVPVSVMHIKGSIDSATYQNFQAKAEEVIAGGALYILVDFSEVTFISSAGLRALHNIFNQLRGLHQDVDDDELRKKMKQGEYKSPYVKVCHLSNQIKEIFELSGFETYIEIHEDVSKAVVSF